MSDPRTLARTLARIDELLDLPAETSWVEFKKDNSDPYRIGTLISALSNGARHADKHSAYVIWGIRDEDHAAIGTTFEPSSQMQKGQPLELWLTQHLRPAIDFSFESVDYRGTRLVLLSIPATTNIPVEFDRTAYIRVGSATLRLSDHPERMKSLWSKLTPYAWETGLALQFLDSDTVLKLLDYPCYFDLTGQPLPENRQGILDRLKADQLVQPDVGDRWSITNLGAILFAKRLEEFPSAIARKAIRFVAYDGASRTDIVSHRKDMLGGYAVSLDDLIDYIDQLLPRNEQIIGALRKEQQTYPLEAIRELIANALIHQDMMIRGAGPLVELFRGRLEITNPGEPLVSPDRFIDSPPRSRNEALTSLMRRMGFCEEQGTKDAHACTSYVMRRMGFCEEQGTGIDKVILAVEAHQLPPPDFRSEGDALRVRLFAPRQFADMSSEERIRACYQHAALRYVVGKRMKNLTLRDRFGIDAKNAAQASAVIRSTMKADLIRPADPAHPRAGYVPFWA